MLKQLKKARLIKIKGSALFYAIALSLVMSVLGSSFILIAYSNRIISNQHSLSHKLLINSISGFNMLKAETALQFNKELDLFEDGIDHVKLQKIPWGLYCIGVSTAQDKSMSRSKIGLLGLDQKVSHIALHVSIQNRPLSLCGNTRLTGDCIIPNAGVKRANVEGKRFTGKEMVNGRSLPSKNLPRFLKQFGSNGIAPKINMDQVPPELIQSFSKSTVIISTDEALILDEYLKGNIIIRSRKQITVDATAQLEDVLLIAPVIKVQNGFEGNFQANASEYINVGKRTMLNYPTSLVLSQTGKIEIGSYASINGDILMGNAKSRLIVDKHAQINGVVLSRGQVSLKGVINGSLYCNQFYLKTPSSIYENHLMDAVINRQALSKDFVASFGLDIPAKQKLVKWLY